MSEPPLAAGTKRCPFCAEEIQAAAKVCRYCQRSLDPTVPDAVSVAANQPTVQPPNNALAAILSIFIPGVGQIYKGQTGLGVSFLVAAIVGYLLFVIPGLLVHFIAVVDAAASKVSAVPGAYDVTCIVCKTPGDRRAPRCSKCGHVFGSVPGSTNYFVECVDCGTSGDRRNGKCQKCGHVFDTPALKQAMQGQSGAQTHKASNALRIFAFVALGLVGLLALGFYLQRPFISDLQSTQQPARSIAPPVAAPATKPAAEIPFPARDSAGIPEAFQTLWKAAATEGKEGQSGVYTYRYAASGDRVAALMVPRPIPRNDEVLIGVIVDVTRRGLGANIAGSSPQIAQTPHGSAVRFDSGRNSYYVLPIKNETQEGAYGPGEPHTLLIWRERR